ncbi:PA3496 family putative envelope integrity protein [Vibrio parahaemolyticus]
MSDVGGFNEWKHKKEKQDNGFALPNTSKLKPNLKKLRTRRSIEAIAEEKKLNEEFDYLDK